MANENAENYANMLKTYKGMLDELKDSKLREQFKRFLYGMTSNQLPLKSVLMGIEGLLSNAQSSQYKDLVYPSTFATKFWNKVKDILVDTYMENTE